MRCNLSREQTRKLYPDHYDYHGDHSCAGRVRHDGAIAHGRDCGHCRPKLLGFLSEHLLGYLRNRCSDNLGMGDRFASLYARPTQVTAGDSLAEQVSIPLQGHRPMRQEPAEPAGASAICVSIPLQGHRPMRPDARRAQREPGRVSQSLFRDTGRCDTISGG